MLRQAERKPRLAGKLRIRRARPRDLNALVHQRRAMWIDVGIRDKERHDVADVVYRKWARARLRNQTLIAWVAETSDSKIVGGGCLWLHPVQPSPKRTETLQPYLLSMYTEPPFRRKGVASLIVGKAIAWSRKQGYNRMVLHASDTGRKVYQQLGFKRTWEMRLDLETVHKLQKR